MSSAKTRREPGSTRRFAHLPKYTEFGPAVPVWCATPETGGVIHRFFDTSPFSPSGRYLGLVRLPFEDRLPSPGDVAQVILADLETGESKVLADTRGWDTQLGAQVQWGADDTQLFFNDVDTRTWKAFGIKLDPFSGARRELDGTVYMVSPDGKWAASPCLLRTRATQAGYGVVVPPERVPVNRGAPIDDGVYITSTSTGKCRLLVSLSDIVEMAISPVDRREYEGGDFYGFHVKWNPQGNRLMLVLRWISRDGELERRDNVITMKADGSDIHIAIPDARWSRGGHHPNWCPDGETIIMNLNVHSDGLSRSGIVAIARIVAGLRRCAKLWIDVGSGTALRFVKVRYDGSDFGVLTGAVPGSGHPTMHPNGRYVVTDAYPNEPVAFGDGTVPIRLIDLKMGQERTLVRANVDIAFKGPRNELRVDPHPAWDRSFRYIAFNACVGGTRRVYIADLASALQS